MLNYIFLGNGETKEKVKLKINKLIRFTFYGDVLNPQNHLLAISD